MNKMRMGFYSVFARILFFNIVLVLIATVIPQAVFYNYFSSAYESEIRRNSDQNISKLKYSVDEVLLERILSVPYIYFIDTPYNENLFYPIYHDINMEASRIISLIESLNDIKRKITIISSVEVFYTNGNIYYDGTNIKLLQQESSEKGLDREWFTILKNSRPLSQWIYKHSSDGQINPVYTFNIPLQTSEASKQAVAAININMKYLNDMVTTAQMLYDEELFIIDENGQVISHSNKENMNKNLYDQQHIQKLLQGGDEGNFDLTVDGRMSVVSYAKSNYNNWRYVSIIPLDKLYKQASRFKMYMILIGVLLLFFNIVISILLTRKVNQPIVGIVKSIVNMVRNDLVMENEKVSELKLVSGIVKNVSYQMEELRQQLVTNRSVIRHSIILRLLNGKLNMEIEDREIKALVDMDNNYTGIICFVIRLFDTASIGIDKEMMIKYQLIEQLEKKTENCRILSIADDNGNVSGIAYFQMDVGFDYVLDIITARIEGLISGKYVLCTSQFRENHKEKLPCMYREACESLRYAYIYLDQKLLRYDALQPENRKISAHHLVTLEKIRGAIRDGDIPKLSHAVESIIEGLLFGKYKIEYCLNTLSDVVSCIFNSILDNGYNVEEFFGYDIREYFKNIENIREFKTWITSLITRMKEVTEENVKEFDLDLREKIQKYIVDNIYNDLSLTSVGEGLHYNASYLSRIFKDIMGMNFSEYVTKLKMEQAESLICEDKYMIKEISQLLGYRTPQHFVKLFKEKNGCTPKEYRDKYVK